MGFTSSLGLTGVVRSAPTAQRSGTARQATAFARGRRVRRPRPCPAISAAGQNGSPGSKQTNDQAQRYADGNLRDVYFYPEQLGRSYLERTYHPGENPNVDR